MRIISGIFGGRKIAMDDRCPVRPTSDKARGALFSSVASMIPGCSFLDICAGTGAMGIEALSRGAAHVTAIEQSQRVIELLSQNTAAMGIGIADFEVLCGDFRTVLPVLAGRTFDVIFADPPYEQGLAQSAVELVALHDLLADDGVLVVEHFFKEDMPLTSAGLEQYKVRKYGQTTMTFYRKGAFNNE
jgi:16S rRNA (guanine(966)-N(2))-methyltransferase RsmD